MKPQDKACIVDGCERESRSRGLCNTHYQRWLRHKDPAVSLINRSGTKTKCVIPGCNGSSKARGLCKTHYAYYRRKSFHVTHA